jgi:hypothetical protein
LVASAIAILPGTVVAIGTAGRSTLPPHEFAVSHRSTIAFA